ncbi:TPA: helix-turn-helix domain-containing protein [Pseudomonas aeruginosa]|uniref:helix-turn-helix domain-containing protein n=1 Tax=Pseudomonas aeruginosa TaxID=287 RepID=UPI00053DEE23|nr:helix-turn-helix domain-containing protein [Pseudomonas aeruginosa]
MGSILSLRHYSHDQIVHSHDHAQLVLGLSGCLEFEVEGRGSRVLRQTFAVVPAQARHACSSPAGSRCLVLDLPCDGSLLLGLGEHAEAGRRLFERPQALSLTPAQGQLVNWLASGPINDPVIAHQGAGLLLASLASERQPPRQQPRPPLASLDAYLDRHAAHPLQVADLARLAGLSVARFHSLFLAETGQTPMDYARSRRLHQAHELLLESSLAVGEIAARVGYASQSAFTAALVREFGVTPRQLRRESRDKTG